jgi:DnaJ-domain-containing protein 1
MTVLLRVIFVPRLLLLVTALLLLLCFRGSNAKEENLYKLLGVTKTATTKEIKSAYRRKALDTHRKPT